MIKLTLHLAFAILPVLSLGQWQLMGTEIDGASDGDKIGLTHSIDMDSTGTTIAFGTPLNHDFFPFSGYAKVMDWNGTDWVQRGDTFFGTDPTLEGTGSCVSLSADGMTVAVSSPWGSNSLGYKCGIVRVFDWNGSAWVLRGNMIEGEGNADPLYSGDVFGTAMELSSDGNKIIVGARANTPQIGVNEFTGHARIYHWNGSSWMQIGQDLDGHPLGGVQEFGYSVSISDDGNRAAVGGRSFNTTVQEVGYARMFEYDGSSWVQMGDTIFGTELGEQLGSAVKLTPDGNSVAIGAPGTISTSTGETRMLDWNGSNWVQRGNSILGSITSKSGLSIDVSFNGDIVAVGEPWANNFNGTVKLHEWNGSSWQQLGTTLSPSNSSAVDAFGSAVRINSNGSRVIIGSPSNTDAGFNTGQISIFGDGSDASLTEFGGSEISFYPNPVRDVLNIHIPGANEQETEITIIDLQGRVIHSEFTSKQTTTINTEMLGIETMFIVRISSEKTSAIFKVVLE